ncbi:MAG: 4,5-DOPA dioxygenase extradiol [Chromatiales bacterium]
MTQRMPAIFFGHGNPMNALASNVYTSSWADIGKEIPKPKAVVAVSAHWYVRGTAVTAMPAPRTIHDFGGFPPELYRVRYPAPGDLAVAQRVQALLAPLAVELDQQWGLDHGIWSVLCHVFPKADVPVVQLSIDRTQPAEFHVEIAKRLAPLRDEGILVIGSGNIVHNLRAMVWGQNPVEPYPWASRFEKRVQECLLAGDVGPLIAYETLDAEAMLSVPTPEHYLPLLYVAGLRQEAEPVSFPVEGIDAGSISMLSVRFG